MTPAIWYSAKGKKKEKKIGKAEIFFFRAVKPCCKINDGEYICPKSQNVYQEWFLQALGEDDVSVQVTHCNRGSLWCRMTTVGEAGGEEG
jgi:hypothetical protein